MTRDTTINRNLRLIMRRKGVRQTELAKLCGLGYQNLHRAVNGRRPIYADELPGLAKALGESVEALLGLEEERGENPWA